MSYKSIISNYNEMFKRVYGKKSADELDPKPEHVPFKGAPEEGITLERQILKFGDSSVSYEQSTFDDVVGLITSDEVAFFVNMDGFLGFKQQPVLQYYRLIATYKNGDYSMVGLINKSANLPLFE